MMASVCHEVALVVTTPPHFFIFYWLAISVAPTLSPLPPLQPTSAITQLLISVRPPPVDGRRPLLAEGKEGGDLVEH